MKAWQRSLFVPVFFGFIFIMNSPKVSCSADLRMPLTATVSGIKFLGGDRYEVRVSLKNYSEGVISIKKIDTMFSLQTEVLGNWISLANHPRGHAEGLSIARGGQKEIVYIIEIQPDISHLYKNYRGDINLKFKYGIELAGTGKQLISGDNLYWIIPGTDHWMLREER
jgi:hypothetical protein